MTEFVVHIDGNRGALFVNGREPDLFGELVGFRIERGLPVDLTPGMEPTGCFDALPKPVVEATLRLPMRPCDRLTLVRGTSIETHTGATSDVRGSGPGAVALLDRWLADHLREPGSALVAKARELLTGTPR